MVVTAALPWRPPAADRQALPRDLWNALVSHAGQPLAIGGPASMNFRVVPPPAPAAPGGRLRLGSGQDVVAVPVEFPFASAYEADLTAADLVDLPPALRDALVEGVLMTAAEALPLASPPVMRGVGPLATLGAGSDWPWFRLAVAGGTPGPLAIDVSTSPGDLAAVFGDVEARRAWPNLAAQLTLAVDATLGRLSLPAADLRGWSAGTAVLLDGDARGRPVRLRTARGAYEFEARDGAWLCRAAEGRRGERTPGRMAEDTGAMGGDTLDIGAIPVDVDFDLGRASVTLAEMETWTPGSLVALPVALTASGVPVTLRVNGSAIGTGDIVSIDGRIAIRVSSLALRA